MRLGRTERPRQYKKDTLCCFLGELCSLLLQPCSSPLLCFDLTLQISNAGPKHDSAVLASMADPAPKDDRSGESHHVEVNTSASAALPGLERGHTDAERADDEKNAAVLLQQSCAATKVEHELTTFEAFMVYKKAVFWSVIVSMGIIMDSYDTQLMGNFYAMPEFQRQFGEKVGNGSYQVSATWQVRLSMAGNVGNIIGVWANSYFCEKFGCKRVLLVSYVLMDGLTFLLFFAPNIQALMAGSVLYNIPIGVFTTLAVGYSSELCPVVLRGYLEIYVLLSWATGQLIAWGILRGFITNSTQWAWRIPYAIQWFWPVTFFIVMIWGPDSPWWLVRRGRIDEARETLGKRLMSPSDKVTPDEVLAMVIHTVDVEREITAGTRFIDIVNRKHLRRTEVVVGSWMANAMTGWVIAGWFAYFYERAGLPTSKAFDLQLGQGGLGYVCGVLAFVISGYVGRRTQLLLGLAINCVLMFLIGILSCLKQDTKMGYAESVLAFLWWGVFQLLTAPAEYAIIGETSALSVRQKTIGVGRMVYNVLGIIGGIISPLMLNPGADNWKGRSAFLPALCNLIWLIWAWYRVPECKHRTFEEIDIMRVAACYALPCDGADFPSQVRAGRSSSQVQRLRLPPLRRR